MSLTVTIAILAIIATLAAALLQPFVSHWLTPKQKLLIEVTGSEYRIQSGISRKMSEFGYQLQAQGKPKPEFRDFLENAERYQSYFNVTLTNTGKTMSRNVVLGCSAYSKYVLIQSRNKSEYCPDQPEYSLGDIQPSEKVECKIWSSSHLPTYDFALYEMFSVRDDHNSSKEIILRRFYDKASYYLLERAVVRNLMSALKWTLLPPALLALIAYIVISVFHWL
jgi:hypothetical protein